MCCPAHPDLDQIFFQVVDFIFSTMTRRPRLNSSSYRSLSKRPNVCCRRAPKNPPWGGEGEVYDKYLPRDLFTKLDLTGIVYPGDKILVFLKKLPTKKKPPPERGR